MPLDRASTGHEKPEPDAGRCEFLPAGAIVCLKPGETLTDEEARILDDYLRFCRERRAKRRSRRKAD
jgi:hypothetical protein